MPILFLSFCSPLCKRPFPYKYYTELENGPCDLGVTQHTLICFLFLDFWIEDENEVLALAINLSLSLCTSFHTFSFLILSCIPLGQSEWVAVWCLASTQKRCVIRIKWCLPLLQIWTAVSYSGALTMTLTDSSTVLPFTLTFFPTFVKPKLWCFSFPK